MVKCLQSSVNRLSPSRMSAPEINCPYCEEYGFDKERRAARLALLELTPSDHALARRLQEDVIRPHLDAIVEGFYAQLLRDREVRAIIDYAGGESHLKETQSDYLLTLGLDFESPGYWDYRLRVGLAHDRVGVPLPLYQAAYRLLQQLIIDRIFSGPDSDLRDRLVGFVLKITALDMSIAIETYHQAQLHDLESSLDALRNERLKLRRKAETDALTGLASREAALVVLRRGLAVTRRRRQALCVIMADLDLFKAVNDTYGHLVGDGVLRDVGQRMRAALRNRDELGRFGGEEFIVVLINTPLKMAREVAERVRVRVAAEPIRHGDLDIPITISQGLAVAKPGDTAEALIDRADRALYRAKQEGRNRVVEG
jgi:two-component system cell cycle response regulator